MNWLKNLFLKKKPIPIADRSTHIFYCDKSDWYTEDEDGYKDWDEEKCEAFWKQLREDKMKRKDYDFSDFIFPEFLEDNFWEKGVKRFFIDKISFLHFTFSRYVSFRRAKFLSRVYFSKVKFLKYTDFIEGQFSEYANFSEAQFSERVDFRETQFSEDAYFGETQFSEDAYFIGAKFFGYVSFRETQFSKSSNFVTTQFLNYTNFKVYSAHSSFVNFKSLEFQIKQCF